MESGKTGPVQGRRGWRVASLLLVLLTGLGLRVAYLQELSSEPEFRVSVVDAAFNQEWAGSLATGDWTGSGVAGIRSYVTPIPNNAYFRPPGYVFFLSSIYRLAGTGPLAPRIAQIALDLATILMGYWLCRRLAGHWAGLLAAALLAGSWVLIYYSQQLEDATLLVFLMMALLCVLHVFIRRPADWTALAAGGLLGLFAVVRPSILLVALILPLSLLLQRERPHIHWRQWARYGMAYLLGILLPILPVTARNAWVSREFVLISANAGINFYIGNNPEATGLFVGNLPELGTFETCLDYPAIVQQLSEKAGRPLGYAEASRQLGLMGWKFIVDRPDLAMELAVRKLFLFFGQAEIAHNREVTGDRHRSFVLQVLPGSFACLLGLSTLGLFFTRQRQPEDAGEPADSAASGEARVWAMSAAWCAGAYCMAFLPFFVTSLYRTPVISILVPLAALGLVAWLREITQSHYRHAAIGAGVGTAIFGLSWISSGWISTDLVKWHFDHAVAFHRMGDNVRGLAEYRETLRLAPDHVDALTNAGILLALLGRLPEAIPYFEKAVSLRPNDAATLRRLAMALRDSGARARAEQLLHQALKLAPDNPLCLRDMADMCMESKRLEQAAKLYERALESDQDDVALLQKLGVVLGRLGQPERALTFFQRAATLKPQRPDIHNNVGLALASCGRRAEAEAAYRRALELKPDYTVAKDNLTRLLEKNKGFEYAAPVTEEHP